MTFKIGHAHFTDCAEALADLAPDLPVQVGAETDVEVHVEVDLDDPASMSILRVEIIGDGAETVTIQTPALDDLPSWIGRRLQRGGGCLSWIVIEPVPSSIMI